MKNIVIIITVVLGLFFIQQANATKDEKESGLTQTSSLSGKVIDKITGEPLVGVRIEIQELNIESYTDFEGNFSFSKLQKGNYNLSTDYISYESSLLKNINLENQNNTLKIELLSN